MDLRYWTDPSPEQRRIEAELRAIPPAPWIEELNRQYWAGEPLDPALLERVTGDISKPFTPGRPAA